MSGQDKNDGWETVTDEKTVAAVRKKGGNAPVELTGDDYLATLDPARAALVKAIAEGRRAAPNGMALRTPYGQQLIQDVYQYDRTADDANLPGRVSARKAFTSGIQGRNFLSIATALDHTAVLDDAITRLGNVRSPIPGTSSLVNGVRSAFRRADGDPNISQFDATVTPLVDELERAYVGAGGNVADVKRLHDGLSANQTQEQQRTALRTFAQLLSGKLDELNKSYNLAMGTTGQTAPGMSDNARNLLSAYTSPDYVSKGLAGTLGGGETPGGPTGGAPGGNPKYPSDGSPSGGGISPYFKALNESGGAITNDQGKPIISPNVTSEVDTAAKERNGRLLAMVSAGKPDDKILAAASSLGIDPATTGLNAILAYRKKTGLTKFADTTDYNIRRPTTFGERIVNTVASDPGNTFIGEAGNAAAAGLPQAIARGIGGENVRNGLDAIHNTNPRATLGGQLVGTALGAAGSEALASKGLLKLGASTAETAAWAPRIGDLAYGEISGATSNPDHPFTGAFLGGAAGLGGGVLGRGLARTAARIGTPGLTNAEGTLLNTAQRGVGTDAIDARLASAANLGVPMGLADASAELTSLGGAAIRRSPAASEIAQNTMIPRSRGQIDRLGSAVARDLGPVDNIPQLSADLSQQARTASGPLYDAAYSAPGAGAVYPKIADLLDRPSMQNALGRARRIALEEGRDPASLGFDLDGEGNVTLASVPSWQTLDYAKRGLDDVLEGYRDSTSGRLNLDTEGKAINDTRKAFLGIVDEANPAYKDARAAYAGPVKSRDAMRAGQDAYRANPNQLGVDVADASPERRGQMQLGYRGAMMDAANGYRTSSNPFEATLGTPAAEQRLGVLYGDTPGTQRLLATRDLERQMGASTNSMLGNSATAQRQIADEAFTNGTPGALLDAGINGLAGGPASGLLSLVRNGLRDGTRLGLGRRAVRRADELAPLLFGTDPQAARMTLGDLMRRAQVRRDAGNNLSVYGGPIGSSSGALLGSYLLSGGN